MRERGEVARRSDAALARDDRHRVAVEQALKRFDDDWADARITAAKAEQLEDDHQPDDVARQRLAEPGAVRQDQVALQIGQPFVGDARVGEQSEAGVDSVDRVAAGDDAFDRRGGGRDALHRRVVEGCGFALPKLAQGRELDRFGVEGQGHGLASGLGSNLALSRS